MEIEQAVPTITGVTKRKAKGVLADMIQKMDPESLEKTRIEMLKELTWSIEIKRCCALCGLQDDETYCPMYWVIKSSRKIGCDKWDDTAKYEMICDNFELSDKFKQEKK